MAVMAALSADGLVVEPGHEGTATLTIANTGDIVEQYTVEMVGETAAWTVVDPPVLSLMPGQEREVVLRFRPPRGPEPEAGAISFGAKVIAKEVVGDTVVEEGEVTVTPFLETRAELVP